jgi:hypothetical protein
VRHFIVAAGLLALAGLASLVGPAGGADTQAAALTRKKLQVKVASVEWKDEMLREVLKELSKAVEDEGHTPLLTKYDTGVSMNQRVTYSAKNKTVAEILDEMFQKPGLGYVVLSVPADSKDKDLKRFDGGLLIKANSKDRGDPLDDKAGKAKEKPKPVVKDKDKEPAKDKDKPAGADKEKDAARKLDLIKTLIGDGKKERAKERLEELIKQYPGTKAAEEAAELIKKLG